MTLVNNTVSDNSGGGIHNERGGSITISSSTVSGNDGHGIDNNGLAAVINSTISGNNARSPASDGGGISNGGQLTVSNSTSTANSAESGGGIFNGATLVITNSTVSGNTAAVAGGIYTSEGTDAIMTNCTVSGNTGGGLRGPMRVSNSVVKDECLDDPALNPSSLDYNIESSGDTCGFGQPTDRVNVSADGLKLGPLQDNGGPTMTHALLTEPVASVAIDVIPLEDCVDAESAPLMNDQRGFPRPVGDGCDVGAFEVQP